MRPTPWELFGRRNSRVSLPNAITRRATFPSKPTGTGGGRRASEKEEDGEEEEGKRTIAMAAPLTALGNLFPLPLLERNVKRFDSDCFPICRCVWRPQRRVEFLLLMRRTPCPTQRVHSAQQTLRPLGAGRTLNRALGCPKTSPRLSARAAEP